MKTIGWESNFKTFTRLFNACCHHYCLCSICIQKGKYVIVKKIGRWGTEFVASLRFLFLFFSVCVCVYWRNYQAVLWSSQSWKYGLTFHIHWYGNVVIVSYVIHTVTSSTCCFWQLGCRCANFYLLHFHFFTAHANMVPFSPSEPVITVHHVNLTVFYFVYFVFYGSVSELPTWLLRL